MRRQLPRPEPAESTEHRLTAAIQARLSREMVDDLLDGQTDAISLAQRLDGDTWADAGVWVALHDAMTKALPQGEGMGSIGVGGLAPTLGDIPRSYREAQQAFSIQTAKTNPHGVTNHDQLGITGLATNHEADDFVQEWLAPLLHYDHRHQTKLTQ